MLQTANVLKLNFTRPIGCRVLAVKWSFFEHFFTNGFVMVLNCARETQKA